MPASTGHMSAAMKDDYLGGKRRATYRAARQYKGRSLRPSRKGSASRKRLLALAGY